uniref:FYVE, RhoGEF and PH domaincontaining protein 4like [Nasonia vitripennis] n=1 Tax=Lepeophtheirus salmonis TaxID=72036 RepID=A0A0K2TZB4_LEPSM
MEFESRKSFNTLCSQEDPVTLISYYSGEHSGRGRVKSTVVPPVIAKKSEKFFKTLRRRSKSASRLGDYSRKESNTNSSSSVSSASSILTYTANGERARNPDRIKKQDKVKLVGFSRSLSDNEDSTSFASSLSSSRFSTLKTSREVKMERDRLRQERLSKLTQETKELIDKLKSEGTSIHRSLFNPNRERFFEEARERLQSGLSSGLSQPPSSSSQSSSSNDNDIISSFLREHQERFSTLLAQRRVASTFFTSSSSGCNNNNNSSIPRKGGEESKRSEGERKVKAATGGVGERREQELGATEEEVTTPVSNSSENDKQFSTGSSSLDQQRSSPQVRHIPVIREFPNPLGENTTTSSSSSSSSNLHRSSSSSSSSGFSSIGRKSGLQGSRTNLSPHHHPSFENHFGFNRFGGGFRADFGVASNSFYPSLSSSPILSSGGKSSSSLNHNHNHHNNNNSTTSCSDRSKRNSSSKLLKINNSKIKAMENSTSNFNRYSTSEEVTITSSFGDSEMESDEDEEDDEDEEEEEEDLDSVSIVVANSSGSGGGVCSSEANSSSATLRHHGGNSSRSKAPRPISAVPSEYSDVSTSSSRTSEGEDDVLVPSSNGGQESIILESNGGDTNSNNSNININNNNNNLIGVNNNHNMNNHHNNNNSNSLKMESFGAVDNRLDKAHRIAKELLSTEEQYVRVLYLIDQVFHTRVDQENRTQNLFSADVLPQMFANIKSIYKFHAEFLLPQLRERMENWKGSNQRIGDIFVKFSPFFKMYTEYVKNFGSAIHLINHIYNKNSKFAGIMDDIHSMPECGNLSLQHHMLTPIQRIPRYEMLLKDYLKKLPEDSDDREDSEKALHLVSTAAAHANDAMKRIEKFKKLLEVQECLSGTVDLVNPTRELVKEGKIVKISARSGDHQERYLFLFSDLLLLCSPRLITNRVIPSGTAPFRLRARFDVESIQVLEGDNLVTANSFYIRDNHKSVELYTQTLEEKEDWLEALFQTIKELYQRKSSLRIGRETLKPLDCEIGRKQPHLLKLDTISKCMDCGHPFSMMRKKHNCRACGIVICAKCSGQKFPLTFEENKPCRVCKTCFNLLNSADFSSCDSSPISSSSNSLTSGVNPPTAKEAAAAAASSNGDSNSNLPSRVKGLLEVSPSDSSLLCGYLQVKPLFNKGPSSKPLHRYFSLKCDGLLYSYTSERDRRALTSTPLRNYGVYRGSLELKGDSNVPGDKDRTIKLVHEPGPCRNTSTSSTCSTTSSYSSSSSSSSNNRKIYYLFSNNLASAERWAEALKAASRGDISLCSTSDKVSMGSSNDLHSSSSSHIEGLE